MQTSLDFLREYESYSHWQIARGRFNHDWLKNQYLPALESFRNILKGQVQRVNSGQGFWEIDLPQWEHHRTEAEWLIKRFEVCVSPRTFLKEVPLCECNEDAKAWMGDVVHALWLARLSVPQLKENAVSCLKNADAAYAKLKADRKEDLDDGMNDLLVLKLDTFRNACHAVAHAFERFPR